MAAGTALHSFSAGQETDAEGRMQLRSKPLHAEILRSILQALNNARCVGSLVHGLTPRRLLLQPGPGSAVTGSLSPAPPAPPPFSVAELPPVLCCRACCGTLGELELESAAAGQRFRARHLARVLHSQQKQAQRSQSFCRRGHWRLQACSDRMNATTHRTCTIGSRM